MKEYEEAEAITQKKLYTALRKIGNLVHSSVPVSDNKGDNSRRNLADVIITNCCS